MDFRDQWWSIEQFLVLFKDLLPFYANIMAENGISGFRPDSWNWSHYQSNSINSLSK